MGNNMSFVRKHTNRIYTFIRLEQLSLRIGYRGCGIGTWKNTQNGNGAFWNNKEW